MNYNWIYDLSVFGHYFDMKKDSNKHIDIFEWMKITDFAVTNLIRQQQRQT